MRKIFTWHGTNGHYGEDHRFPGFVSELASGNQFYGLPAENNVLKIGKHNGGQVINSPDQRTPFGSLAEDENEVFEFLHQVLPGVGAVLHGHPALTTTHRMRISSSTRCLTSQIPW